LEELFLLASLFGASDDVHVVDRSVAGSVAGPVAPGPHGDLVPEVPGLLADQPVTPHAPAANQVAARFAEVKDVRWSD